MFYELQPTYDVRKSFYGKAHVKETKILSGDIIVYDLYSYDTLVAKIRKDYNKIEYNYLGKYSQTTSRHQKEFFKQNGLNDKDIKELIKNGKLIKNR